MRMERNLTAKESRETFAISNRRDNQGLVLDSSKRQEYVEKVRKYIASWEIAFWAADFILYTPATSGVFTGVKDEKEHFSDFVQMVAAYKNNNTHPAHLRRRRTAVVMQSSSKRLPVESRLQNRVLISSRTENTNYSAASIIRMDEAFFFLQVFSPSDIFSSVRNRVARSKYNLKGFKQYNIFYAI